VPGVCQHCRVTAEETGSWLPRRIDVPSLPNLRELGGAPAGGNRTVRPGTLYRSTQLAGLAEHDRPVVEALGLAVVVDLRTAFEVQRAPDVPVTDTYVWLDVLHDFAMASTVGVEDLFDDPRQFHTMLRDGTATAMMHEAYVAMVELPSARDSYGRWLQQLAVGDGPVLVHCTNGKDRTGWAVALALLAVGVDIHDVFTDYLTTNEQLLPVFESLIESVEQKGVDPELLMPVIGVRHEYLTTALDRVEQRGGLSAYLASLGVDEHTLDGLRDRLTH